MSPAGDSAALSALLADFLREPQRLADYAPSLEDLPSVAQDAEAVLEIYREVRSEVEGA